LYFKLSWRFFPDEARCGVAGWTAPIEMVLALSSDSGRRIFVKRGPPLRSATETGDYANLAGAIQRVIGRPAPTSADFARRYAECCRALA
jgi:hypothetical protein